MKKSLCFAIVGFVVFVCLSASAGAADVAIVNPSFETPVKADSTYSEDLTDCPGWSVFDNGRTGGYIGVWNIESQYYGGNAPEGENIAYVSKYGFAQILTETLTAGMQYTLTVEVGYLKESIWDGYKVQLLADGTVLAEDNDTVTIAENTFRTSTVTYAYDPADSALLGQPLQIRLLSLDGGEADFDDVQLTVIPEPATMGLLGMGALALIRRKRK